MCLERVCECVCCMHASVHVWCVSMATCLVFVCAHVRAHRCLCVHVCVLLCGACIGLCTCVQVCGVCLCNYMYVCVCVVCVCAHEHAVCVVVHMCVPVYAHVCVCVCVRGQLLLELEGRTQKASDISHQAKVPGTWSSSKDPRGL